MTMVKSRQLVVIRHAHSPFGPGDDQERTLSPEGMSQAQRTGQWLSRRLSDWGPESCRAIVSPAIRTQQTWEAIASAIPTAPASALTTTAELYLADAAMLLEQVRGLSVTTTTAIIVAHNPGVSHLCRHLATPAGASLLEQAYSQAMPPATAVLFTVPHQPPSGWSEVATQSLEVSGIHLGS